MPRIVEYTTLLTLVQWDDGKVEYTTLLTRVQWDDGKVSSFIVIYVRC